MATDTGSVGRFQKTQWHSEFRWSIQKRYSNLVQEMDGETYNFNKMCLVLEW